MTIKMVASSSSEASQAEADNPVEMPATREKLFGPMMGRRTVQLYATIEIKKTSLTSSTP